ncbi:hypothetical protein NQ315_008697 [Exocentrus adspersus]|uniref:Uncharacterized protein n=1 Tax=Exocentrus adspersus TaxID=1586481 RepID=A0AAV8W7D4_9CUCU|nr:hypothetical protein NQ315_008697 [Exocentrus adspersus]
MSLQRFSGRSAIVTGSTLGIGYAIAKRLAEEGAKVIISSRNKKNVEDAVKKLKQQDLDVKGVVCHVNDSENRKQLLQEAEGKLDILVCSAGVNPAFGPLFQCSEPAWDKTFEVNVKASFLLTKEALPLLRRSKAGRVIYHSTASVFHHLENLGTYAVSKAALCTLTKYAAYELGPGNITVNCIAPGYIKTRFSEKLAEYGREEGPSLPVIPLRRQVWGRYQVDLVGSPEDVSGLVAFLVSDEAAYITGENIVISGGK